jgi:hypothetical protein
MANQAVYGIVANRAKVEQIIQALVDMGVNSNDISFLSSQGEDFKSISNENFATDANRNWRNEERVTDYPAGTTAEERYRSTNPQSSVTNTGHHANTKGTIGTEKHTKAPEGATTGATTGGVIGGVLGLLAGIGALAIPGVGPFIAAGPIMATLGGMGLGGALGTIVGGLIGLGIPEYEAKRYESRLHEGGILLSVRANSDDLAKRIKDLLVKHGAEDVTISSESSATAAKDYRKK